MLSDDHEIIEESVMWKNGDEKKKGKAAKSV